MHFSPSNPGLRHKPLLALLLAPFGLLNWSNAHAVNVNTDCAALYGTTFVAKTGQVVASTPSLPRPLKGVIYKDPSFGTCVVRATDHAVEPPNNFARNDYSRRQAFNADNTRFIVYASGGAWHMYDATTLAYIRQLSGPSGDAEPQWDAVDPKSLYYIPSKGGMTISKLNVETNTHVVAADFTGKLPWSTAARAWTASEGSPSADGRYWCMFAENSSSGILGAFTYDMQTQTVLGTKTLTSHPNNISMSPSGRWCVISGTTAWNPTFTTSKTLLSGAFHSDLARGADGHDYFVYSDQASTGYIIMVDIDTGLKTPLIPTWVDGTATSLHISGKAFSRPGWIVVSTFNHSGTTEKYLHERVMAIEMKANPTMISLAHHHSYYNGYWTQPQGSVSRDFSRILFNSNWGTTSDMDVDAYMIRLPDNLFGGTVTPPPPPPADTTAPVVSASEVGTSGTITLAATATDNVGVSSVDFMVDGVLKGSDSSSPYSIPLASSTLANGSHSLVAIGYDAASNAGRSTAVPFSISNTTTPPPGDTTAPSVTASATVSVGSVLMKAAASDNVGVAKVEFYIDNVLKGSDTTSPYELSWNTTTYAAGSTHTVTAKAYDAAGNVSTSAPVSFTTSVSTGDITPPRISVALKVDVGSITMSAAAKDRVGVTKVEFYIDGQLKAVDYSRSYSAVQSTATWWPKSTHTYTAKAYDAAGNVGTSAGITFTIP